MQVADKIIEFIEIEAEQPDATVVHGTGLDAGVVDSACPVYGFPIKPSDAA